MQDPCNKAHAHVCILTSIPPMKRCPLGLFFIPLSRCHMPPPTAPIPKAPPTSSRILHAQGQEMEAR